jgi:ketosteroid isomerase-like protein
MSDTREVVDRLLAATNDHDLDAIVDCFAIDYVNETPAHPLRGFRGRDQVRRNWTTIFARVPEITARVVASSVDGSTAWTEWEMSGTTRDGANLETAGVVIFVVKDDRIASARFYLEPVEHSSGDVDAAVQRATGRPTP